MPPTSALTRLGGVASHAEVLELTTRARLRAAVADGSVLRISHGRYALPTADLARQAAARLSGAASHLSAAAIHGWELGHQPARPAVIVARNRKIAPSRRQGVDLRWRRLTAEERADGVTGMIRTVLDCAVDLPFPEALAVADSALRHRDVDLDELVRVAGEMPTTGRTEALAVARAATRLAANPFESMLRGIAKQVPGLDVEAQAWVVERGFRGRPDLVDRKRRIIIEADSFEFHGRRKALKDDCERYNALVLRGWTVVRFAWEHVMFEPDYVRDVLTALVEGPSGRAALAPSLLYSA